MPHFRTMRAQDVRQVARFEHEIFPDAWTYEQLLSETDGTKHKYPIIMEEDDQIAGYACVWAFADEVHINNFAVIPAFRRKGLGLKLIRFIFSTFQGYAYTFLEVRVSNKAAIGLYKKAGFEPFFTRANYYADNEDALVMKKNL